MAIRPLQESRAAKRGGFQTGGFPDLDLSFLFCPFLFFLGLSRFCWDFPDLLRDGLGIFPISPSPLSRPIKSTYEEQSRKGPRHNLDLSQKKGKHPGLETPRFSFSQKRCKKHPSIRWKPCATLRLIEAVSEASSAHMPFSHLFCALPMKHLRARGKDKSASSQKLASDAARHSVESLGKCQTDRQHHSTHAPCPLLEAPLSFKTQFGWRFAADLLAIVLGQSNLENEMFSSHVRGSDATSVLAKLYILV